MKSAHTQGADNRPVDYVDTMDAAASVLGYKVEWLRILRDDGCPAFRAGRVYLSELEEWVDSHAKRFEEIQEVTRYEASLETQLKEERVLRMRHERELREGRFITIDEHHEIMTRFNQELRSTLETEIEETGPDALTMRTRDEASDLLRGIFDRFCAAISRGDRG